MNGGSVIVLLLFVVLGAVVLRGWIRAERWRARGGSDGLFDPPDDEP